MKWLVLLEAGLGCVLGTFPATEHAQETRKFSYVDLQPKANQKLADNFAGDEDNNLAGLPTGEQTFEEVKFKIGDGLLQLRSNLWKAEKPERKRPDKVGIISWTVEVERTLASLGTSSSATV
jgi:hypothetical protein